MASPHHIPLDRRFKVLGPEASATHAWESYMADMGSGWSGTCDWPHLLAHAGIVVVLGEAGSGKTREFQHMAARQQEAGKAAFFLPLDRLAGEPVAQILGPERTADFIQWQSAKEGEAWLLLDSVDEAKLAKVADFYTALDRLRHELGGAIRRARIILSSRISEWRPETDKAEVLERLGSHLHPPDPPAKDQRLLVVEIAPLDPHRVSLFAKASSPAAADAFLEAVDHGHAWELAGRPLDVLLLLLRYWNTHQRLGTLTETLEYLVTEQLNELQEHRERAGHRRLTRDRARSGAEHLAAASLLCRKVSFQVPDDRHAAAAADALQVRDCLPADWEQPEITALLERCIFDSASYGHIRFHHRRVAEYLAACWLKQRLAQGMPWSKIQQLFFDDRRDIPVIRPALAPIAVWLISLSQDESSLRLREELLLHAPLSILQGGDPEKLDSAFKVAAVDRFVALFQDKSWRRPSTDPATLSRLSDPALAGRIIHHLQQPNLVEPVRLELVKLAGHARLGSCKSTLFGLLRDASSSLEMRVHSLQAIGSMATVADKQEVAAAACTWPVISPWEADELFDVILPEACPVRTWSALMLLIEDNRESLNSTARTLAKFITDIADNAVVNSYLDEMERLMNPMFPLHHDGEWTQAAMSKNQHWMIHVALALLSALLERPFLTTGQQEWAGLMYWRLKEGRYIRLLSRSLNPSLGKQTQGHPQVRQIAYWHAAKYAKIDDQISHMLPSMMAFNIIALDLQLTAHDKVWLLADSRSRKSVTEQISCLLVLLQYGRRGLLSGDWRVLWSSLRWPHFGWYAWSHWISIGNQVTTLNICQNHSPFNASGRRNLWESAAEVWNDPRLRWLLARLRAQYRKGKREDILKYLILKFGSENNLKVSEVDWAKLQAEYGPQVSRDAQSGCIAFWRLSVPSARGESEEMPYLELVGLRLEFEKDENFFATLKPEQALSAALHATHEINGLAEWLPQLAQCHPAAVRQALGRSLRVEWGTALVPGKYPHVLRALANSMNLTTKVMAPFIRDLLLEREAEDYPRLQAALTVLIHAEAFTVNEWSQLAGERIRQLPADDLRFVIWLGVWLDADADAAFEFIEHDFPRLFREKADAVGIFAGLGGRRDDHPRLQVSFLSNLANLHKMLRIIFEWVPPSTDITRKSGEPFEYTPRDEAQHYRGRLLNLLAEHKDPAAESVLRSLLSDPLFEAFSASINYQLEKRIEATADGPPLTPAEVLALAAGPEHAPHAAQPPGVTNITIQGDNYGNVGNGNRQVVRDSFNQGGASDS